MALLLLVNVWAMLLPAAADAPIMAALALIVQLKVVLLTKDVNEILVTAFEQIVCALGAAVTSGVGFTVML